MEFIANLPGLIGWNLDINSIDLYFSTYISFLSKFLNKTYDTFKKNVDDVIILSKIEQIPIDSQYFDDNIDDYESTKAVNIN